MDAAPAVISPLCSPLVARVGMLLRQTGILKQWKQCVGVLTRDGVLHVFQTDSDDVATHEELLLIVLRYSSLERYGSGGGAPQQGRPQRGVAPPPQQPQALPHDVIPRAISSAVAVTAAAPDSATAASAAQQGSEADHPPAAVTNGQDISVDAPEGQAAQPPTVLAAVAAALPAVMAVAAASSAPMSLPPPALPAHIIKAAADYATNVSDLQPPAINADLTGMAKKAEAPATAVFQLTPTTKTVLQPSVHANAFELVDKTGWFGSTRLTLRATSGEDVADWCTAIQLLAEQLASVAAE